jgi:L-lactate utilization protein LutC|tara:strand:- start:692 stop:946 length:255 start_codon:yes stop_codon:yes gene_type:complete
MAKYAPKEKKEYYLKNREKRLEYQNEYYQRTKYSYSRKMEIGKVLEPEEYESFKNRVSDYNKEYYTKNKAKIMAKRREASRKSK